MVWPYLKAFYFSKDDHAGHSSRKNKKKRWEDNIVEWKGVDFANSTRAAEDRTRWKGIVVKSSMMPQRPHKVMG